MEASSEAITTLGNAMTTADWAIVISLIALTLALAGFVWDIWSKFIYPKPKTFVHLSYILSFDLENGQHPKNGDRALRLTIVNHGPGPITITQTMGRLERKTVWKRPLGAILKTYGNWPYETESWHIGGFNLPTKLDVGENLSHFLRPHENNYNEVVKFGYLDSFDRVHWANRRSVRRAKKSLVAKSQQDE